VGFEPTAFSFAKEHALRKSLPSLLTISPPILPPQDLPPAFLT